MENKKTNQTTKKEETAVVYGKNVSISTKQSIEICKYIRNKKLDKAIKILERVIEHKHAIPYTRFNADVGHKTGIAAGRYPEKSCKEIIRLLKSVKANAQVKGLDESNLKIIKICANKGSKAWRYGRKRRRQAKRTNIEIVVKEHFLKQKTPKAKLKAKEEKIIPNKETKKEILITKEMPKKEIKKEAPKEEKPKQSTHTPKIEKTEDKKWLKEK